VAFVPYAMLAFSALLAVLTGVSEAGGLPSANAVRLAIFLGAVLVNLFIVCTLTWFNRISHMEQAERERAVAELGEANRRLEATLAENAGLHKQLLAQAGEAGALDERQRMAREIHDTLAQGSPASSPSFRQPGRLARTRWSELNRIPVHVVTTGTARPVRPDAESALLRAAQEALANVTRHAAAARVWATLSYMDDEVVLDVRDDGSGFDLSGGGRDGGFGLVAMRQRIEGAAGTLQVESEPGQGTAISAGVPVAAERVPA
jgi:signal transduction histidine kinase